MNRSTLVLVLSCAAMLGCIGQVGGTVRGGASGPGPTPVPGTDAGVTSPIPIDGGPIAEGCGEVPTLPALFTGAQVGERPLTWTGTDGTLFLRGAGRVRGRHENEGEFSKFLELYFENRTFEFVVEDTIPAGGSTIRITWLPLVQNRGPNLRAFYTGDGNVFHQNVTMDEHAQPDGSFTYDFVINRNARTGEALAVGDMVEFEFGVFLATNIEGRTNYYSDTYRYIVGDPSLHPLAEPGDDALSAGDATIPDIVVERELSFSQYALNLPHEWLVDALNGRRRFHTDFVAGGHTEGMGPVIPELVGLAGPRLNQTSCAGCHVRNGRGQPPAEGATNLGGAVLRLASASVSTQPDDALGGQLQDRAIGGSPEARFSVQYETITGTYGDGSPFELVRPVWNIDAPGETPRISARIAPPMIGLGLLEAVASGTVIALADPDDCNRDGISGRPNIVVDPADGVTRLGRFGWRASKASVTHQTAGALANDMGITTSLFPRPDCGASQDCPTAGAELSDEDLNLIATYARTIGVPPRRHVGDAAVERGAALFADMGCASCHASTLRTDASHAISAFREQTIHPYTDLLLHDMGEALADGVEGEGRAAGYEWRTTPLWGIGLTDVVSGEGARYLHDGRARTLAEAILWHGGEAQAARDGFAALSRSDRDAMIAFLESL